MIGRGPFEKNVCVLLSGLSCAFRTSLFKRFGAANHELAAHEFLVVEFRNSAFRFIHRLHLYECKSFGAHVVAINDDFDILHRSDTVEEVEQVAFAGFE